MKKLDANELQLQYDRLTAQVKYYIEKGNFDESDLLELRDLMVFSQECISVLHAYEDTIDYYKHVINNITEQINELP